jgi:hypothetical protein
MKKKFPLGFWNYVETGVYGPEAVKDWAGCGMTLVHSPHFDIEKHDSENLLKILDECDRQGIKVIIDDKRALWEDASIDPTGYRNKFKAAYDTFGKHPATFGFYIGDEPRAVPSYPHSKQFDDAIVAHTIQLELAPELTPFINLNPYRKGKEKEMLLYDSFEKWAEDFVKASGLRIFSYDNYTQMNPQGPEKQGINDYYENLRMYSKVAKKAGIPFWVTNLSVGHFRYRCPKEDDLRWQLNTSIASGAKCVWWFFFYMRLTRINYRVAPIDEHWERTETFEWLSRVQRSFQHTYGALMAELTHESTVHCEKAYGGYNLFEENEHPIVKKVRSENGVPSVLSFFHDSNGRKYMAIVNNSQTESDYFTYYFKKSVKSIYRIAWGGEEVDASKNDVCNRYSKTDDGSQNSAWLAPGQMEVYRLEI